ncbi:RAB6-interacting golgin [Gryllus bimaculatus]|nr:RAB6-interacting golgin [Gryllus bimaculatus]
MTSDLALLRGVDGSSAASDLRRRCSSIGQFKPRAIRARSWMCCSWRTDLATVSLRGARGVFCVGLAVLQLTFDGNTMWDGFSEADIERLKSGECPTKGLTAGSGPVVAARRHATHLRGSARKNSARERLLRPGAGGGGDADGGAVDIPDGARLSAPKVVDRKNQDNSRLTPKNEDENSQLISIPDSKDNECETTPLTKEKTLNVETSTNQGPVCIKIKEGKNYEVLSSEKTPLDEFQSRHKMMEEQNRRRKELLAKALADRKRYDKAEKEFLEAKLHLFGKLERKELLTEHLCKIIEQNEMRKAKKLSELMDKLELENPVEYTEEEQKNTVGSVIIPTLCALDEVSYSACNTLKSRQHEPKHSPKTSSEELENNLSSNSIQSSSVAPTKDSADAVEDSNSTAMNKVEAVDTTTYATEEIGDKLAKESV